MTRTLVATALLALAAVSAHPQQPAAQTPQQAFLHPAEAAKPMVRWWWFGPAVTKPEILRELQQMKADGIGGAELAFVYAEALDSPTLKNFSFNSPEMLDAVAYANTEGRHLGLRIDVTLCSGWPYGGPATPLSEAVTRLRIAEVAVPSGASSVSSPTLAAGETLLSASIARALPSDSSAPAAPAPGGRRDPAAQHLAWAPNTARPLPLTGASTTLPPSSDSRVALFFIQSHTRQQVKRAAVGAEGFVLDPFSKAAVATHLRAVGEPLVRAFGNNPPYAIFSDSLEAYGADWTPALPEEFKKRRGYDLMPHLTELVGGGSAASDTIRHDYGRTLTELVDENYLTQINSWAKAHNTVFRSQTYGEPAVSFSSQNLVGLIEGEGPQWRGFSTLRWATSAGHVFGRNVISGETFTWLHSPVFRATPLDMKAEADVDFIMGENSLSFHGWPYSPPEASATGEPGWSLYAAAVFNDQNPWHPVMPAVTAYITRVSSLLRQGDPANQVAILLPQDDAWSNFHPGQTTITGAMSRLITPALMSSILSAGYNVDFIDADAINKVGLGTHQILVLPPTDRIPLETLQKLAAFTQAGGKVIALNHAPSMDPEGKTIPELSRLSDQLFRSVVPDEAHLPDALHAAARPDLQLQTTSSNTRDQIGFIRRHTPTADVYFIANTSNHPVESAATLATSWKSGTSWDPDTTAHEVAPSSTVQLHLAPYESRVFIFSADAPTAPPAVSRPSAPPVDLSSNWNVTFTGTGKSSPQATLTDWAADAATKNYSGEAVYTRDFTLPAAPSTRTFLEIPGGTALPGAPNSIPDHGPVPGVMGRDGLPNPLITRTGPGMHAYFDPPIREAALVVINGKPAGALWHPPYRLDVTPLLKPGANHIEIHVYNTALNAWSALPPHDYKPLIAKYGDRFQMQDLDKVAPLPSGILGPIHLVTEPK